MLTLFIAVGSFVGYLIAYHTYGRWLSQKIFQLNDETEMPSHELRDDVDFVPTKKCHECIGIGATEPQIPRQDSNRLTHPCPIPIPIPAIRGRLGGLSVCGRLRSSFRRRLGSIRANHSSATPPNGNVRATQRQRARISSFFDYSQASRTQPDRPA